jgi:hypothetical protein
MRVRLTDSAPSTTLPAMRAVIIRTSFLSGNAKVRHLEVSLPRIDCLSADLPGKYFEPGTLPPSTDGRLRRVSLRTMVRAAVLRENAREVDHYLAG